MKKIIVLLSGCLIALTGIASEPPASQIFQMRLVASQPSGDTEQMLLVHKAGARPIDETLSVRKKVLLDQRAVKSARVITDSLGQPQIQITFTRAGRKQFAEVTRDSIHQRLAIVIAGNLYAAPIIQSEIPGGVAEISGNFSRQQAEQLASRIRDSLGKQ